MNESPKSQIFKENKKIENVGFKPFTSEALPSKNLFQKSLFKPA